MPKGQVQTERAIARVGERHGMLVITEFLGSNKHRRAIFKCVCDCGGEVSKESGLLRGDSHCGCKTKERLSAAKFKHGHSPRGGKSSINSIWSAMKKRCSNPNNRDYKWYGGKGVSVCERWLSFDNFLADMGDGYFEGATIDRIDPDGNYDPSNCRWITHKENVSRSAVSKWESMSDSQRAEAISVLRAGRYADKAEKRNGKYRGG